jgi:hypothetical protein
LKKEVFLSGENKSAISPPLILRISASLLFQYVSITHIGSSEKHKIHARRLTVEETTGCSVEMILLLFGENYEILTATCSLKCKP